MHRDQPFGGRHFGPVADAADMAGIAQRDRGKARFLHFSMPIRTACGATVWP